MGWLLSLLVLPTLSAAPLPLDLSVDHGRAGSLSAEVNCSNGQKWFLTAPFDFSAVMAHGTDCDVSVRFQLCALSGSVIITAPEPRVSSKGALYARASPVEGDVDVGAH